jgi:hypothetical protein
MAEARIPIVEHADWYSGTKNSYLGLSLSSIAKIYSAGISVECTLVKCNLVKPHFWYTCSNPVTLKTKVIRISESHAKVKKLIVIWTKAERRDNVDIVQGTVNI